MRLRVVLVVLAAWIAILSGCNTMRGLGQDVEAVGEAIQRKTR